METKNDGGPAFPTENARQTGNTTFHYEGISLRDYFAAAIMSGRESQGDQRTYNTRAHFHPEWSALSVNEWQAALLAKDAEHCYAMADAMLEARGNNQ